MVKLAGVFSKFRAKKILLLGDYMLDKYTFGTVERISPEAPVSVLKVIKEHSQPGGAGNVVLNILALGSEVISVGRIGQDSSGDRLKEALQLSGGDIKGLIEEKGYLTPTKNRLIAVSQQMLRIDQEEITPLSKVVEEELIKKIAFFLKEVDVVAISDYGKGFLTPNLLSYTIEGARKEKIPVIVDPKGTDFSKYKNCYMLKPNLSEAYRAANLAKNESLEKVAGPLFETTKAEYILITRSEEGITLFHKSMKRKDFPVRSKEVKDVTGAGDTVLAVMAVCLANDFKMDHAIELSNIAAGIAIEHVGCAKITLSDLASRLLELDIENKVFEESHLFALEEILKGKKYLLLGLESSRGMTNNVFKSILNLSKGKCKKLVIYFKDHPPEEDFVSLLSSLSNVDYIVLQKKSLKSLCEKLHPDERYEIINDNLSKID
jgi:D-glycero-beta-D-manno-heptose-7-phosphate kinase